MPLFKRIICVILVCITLMSTLIACGNKPQEAPLPTIIPEKQLMADTYEPNEDINQFMTYTVDYVEEKKDKLTDAFLFNHPKVQVDAWETIDLGLDQLSDVVAIIEAANQKYVEEKTAAVIAERQAAIDAEYNKEKEAAEKKGKTYDKPKKQVRTDDIKFDNPYTYSLYLNKDLKTAYEYEETRLIDSAKTKGLYLLVSKYGIPYVQLDFITVDGVWKYDIMQESDWVVNGISAANVSKYITKNDDGTVTTPEFVDVDNLNKAAKNNIRMSGNIVFNGEGFTWESLELLCNALELEEKKKDTHSFSQSSDKQFTYYTILITLNPFEKDVDMSADQLIAPVARLVATFDPLTQVCVGWKLDLYSKTRKFAAPYKHDLIDTLSVNVHEYQVDTNNYEDMRKQQYDWIVSRSNGLTTAYVAVNEKGEMVGVVRSGMINVSSEIDINGETYYCQDYTETSSTSGSGYYVKQSIMDDIEAGKPKDPDKYLAENTQQLTIKFCVTDGTHVYGYINLDNNYTFDSTFDNKTYYVADDQNGEVARTALFLSEENANAFVTYLVKLYKLTEQDHVKLQDIMYNEGLIKVREHINEMFKQAEKDQAENTVIVGDINTLLTANVKQNYDNGSDSTKKLSYICFGEQTYSFTELKENDLLRLGYSINKNSSYKEKNAAFIINGLKYTSQNNVSIGVETKDENIVILTTTDKNIQAINTIHVGMSVTEALSLCKKTKDDIINNNFLILKSDKTTLVLKLNVWTDVVTEITWINNSIFKKDGDDQGSEGSSGEEPAKPTEPANPETQLNTSIADMAVNTTKYLGSLDIDNKKLNIFTLKSSDLRSSGITVTNKIKIASNSLYEFKGVALTTDNIQNGFYVEFIGTKGASAIYVTNEMCRVSDLNLYVGMSRSTIQELLKDDKNVDCSANMIILKSDHNVLILEMSDNAIKSMCLINNDKFTTK